MLCLCTICICKQAIATKRNLTAAVFENMLEHPLISFPRLVAVNAAKKKRVWSTYPLSSQYSHKQCMVITDTSESVAHLLWRFCKNMLTKKSMSKEQPKGQKNKFLPRMWKVKFCFALLFPFLSSCWGFLHFQYQPTFLTNIYNQSCQIKQIIIMCKHEYWNVGFKLTAGWEGIVILKWNLETVSCWHFWGL